MDEELDAYLQSLDREDCYRVEEVLKEAPHETTELVRLIGAGGAEFGPLVRKRIHRDAAMGAAYGQLFCAQKEGWRFNHLPRIYDVYERDCHLVVLMEYVRGETLGETAASRGSGVELARALFPSLCDAVGELHQSFSPPIIHRDLKPSNIIVSGPMPVIIDLGIARAYREGASQDTALLGTRGYAAPEQFGFGQSSERTDVYALGMLLSFLLTGEDPTPDSMAAGFVDPRIPEAMRAVIVRAAALDSQDRYGSVQELKEAFIAAAPSQGPGKGWAVSTQVPASRKATGVSKPFERLGLVWDGVLGFAWVVVLAACASCVAEPSQPNAHAPALFLIFEYFGFIALGFTGFAVAAMDTRWLRRKFPQLESFTLKRRIVFGIAANVAAWIIMAVLIWLAYMGWVPGYTL